MSFLHTEGNGNHRGLELKVNIFLGKYASLRKRKCNGQLMESQRLLRQPKKTINYHLSSSLIQV